MDEALVVDSVVKEFGDTKAVNQMTFSAKVGEVLALLGPNGAGKSTTLDMCTGFTSPTSGSIRVLGLDPAKQPQKVRERIGIMLQGGGSYSGLGVQEMLELTASYHLNPHHPDRLIDLLGLRGVARTPYRRLSGGQQQRLSLALALIGRPELVFLDEPATGLDAQSRHLVWDIINALQRDGVTVILTTHSMDEAETLANHVVIVDRGRVVIQGSPAELMAEGSQPTITLKTADPLDLDELNRAMLPFALEAEATRRLNYHVYGHPTPEILAALAHEARRQDVLITELRIAQQSLEDVFLEITGRELRS